MNTIQKLMKQSKDAGERQEKKLKSGRHSAPANEKIQLKLSKLHGRVEVNRMKYLEINRAKNNVLAASLLNQLKSIQHY